MNDSHLEGGEGQKLSFHSCGYSGKTTNLNDTPPFFMAIHVYSEKHKLLLNGSCVPKNGDLKQTQRRAESETRESCSTCKILTDFL